MTICLCVYISDRAIAGLIGPDKVSESAYIRDPAADSYTRIMRYRERVLGTYGRASSSRIYFFFQDKSRAWG